MPSGVRKNLQGITIREAARRLDVTEGAIRKWIKDPAKGFKTLPDGTIDPDYLDAQAALVRSRNDPIMGGKRIKGHSLIEAAPLVGSGNLEASNTPVSFEDVRKANVLRTIRQQDLDYAVAAKTLVMRDTVEKGLTDLGALVAASIDRLLDKLPAVLAAETDAHKIRVLLESHFDESKNDMAHRAEQIGKGLSE
ncbi:MAG: hypothetical protein WCK93_12370 [Nitrosomonadales bacterium]